MMHLMAVVLGWLTCVNGLLNFPPEIDRVIINIGSNLQPVLPPAYDIHSVAIAYEPIVGHNITPSPNLFVVHAAVGGQASISMMRSYNRNGESSSLSTPSQRAAWNQGANMGGMHIVPVLPMRLVLASLPPHIRVWYLKTDMQGYDFEALVGAGELLRERVHYIQTEVWLHNKQSYLGVYNDFCLHHLPYMRKQGFEIAMLQATTVMRTAAQVDAFCAATRADVRSAGMSEGNAFWRRAIRKDRVNEDDVPVMSLKRRGRYWDWEQSR